MTCEQSGSPEWISAAIDLVGVLLATFVGAFLAFRYETRQRARHEEEAQVRSGQRALFALVAQVSALENLDTQHLAVLRDDPGRELKLRVIGVGHQVPSCDVDSLTFLMQTDPQLLASLLDGQQTFDSLFYTIEQHNRFDLEFQDRLAAFERSGNILPTQLTKDMLERVTGPNIVRSLSGLTEEIFHSYEQARRKIHSNFTQLREALSRRFPRAKFFTFDLVRSGKSQG